MKFNAKHISIFLPADNMFYRRLYRFISSGFNKQGWQVSGECRLLTAEEMKAWVLDKKPDAIFEMNRVKAEIPVLYDLKIPHITWVVDMAGRAESQIKGSEITYFIDPGWEFNFDTGGFSAWMPPGTCVDTFRPLETKGGYYDFSFVGHIPQAWTEEELNRPISNGIKETNFKVILEEYNRYMGEHTYFGQTHESCIAIIDNIVESLLGGPAVLSRDIYYDLLIRTKRVNNRAELIDFALGRSDSVAIFGSRNWADWDRYSQYYRGFVDNESELNEIHVKSAINLHDGIAFHFRSIDCMASGGLLLWYNTNDGDKFGTYRNTLSANGPGNILGLSNYFQPQYHYYEFTWQDFDQVYQQIAETRYFGSAAMQDTIKIIMAHHTWDNRVSSMISDMANI